MFIMRACIALGVLCAGFDLVSTCCFLVRIFDFMRLCWIFTMISCWGPQVSLFRCGFPCVCQLTGILHNLWHWFCVLARPTYVFTATMRLCPGIAQRLCVCGCVCMCVPEGKHSLLHAYLSVICASVLVREHIRG